MYGDPFWNNNKVIKGMCMVRPSDLHWDAFWTCFNMFYRIYRLFSLVWSENEIGVVTSWDSSAHENSKLNRVTPDHEKLYMIVKVIVRLSDPAPLGNYLAHNHNKTDRSTRCDKQTVTFSLNLYELTWMPLIKKYFTNLCN